MRHMVHVSWRQDLWHNWKLVTLHKQSCFFRVTQTKSRGRGWLLADGTRTIQTIQTIVTASPMVQFHHKRHRLPSHIHEVRGFPTHSILQTRSRWCSGMMHCGTVLVLLGGIHERAIPLHPMVMAGLHSFLHLSPHSTC